jgi:hypothetical protein
MSLITPASEKLLRAMQRKYKDHYTFFKELTLLYEGQRMTGEQEKAAKNLVLIEEMVEGIENVILEGGFSKEKFADLLIKFDEFEHSLIFFQNKGADSLSKAMQTRIEKTEEKTNIKLENLSKSAQIIKGRAIKLSKPSFEDFKGKHPHLASLASGAGGVGTQILGSVLGPLAGLATKGIEFQKRRKARNITNENLALTDSLLLEGEKTPENKASLYKNLFDEKTKIPETLADREGLFSNKIGSLFEGGKKSSKVIAEESFSNVGLREDLFNFFQHDAFKAAWTRDLLNAIKGMPGGAPKKQESSSNLLGEMVALKAMLPMLLLASKGLALGATAFAGWKAGRWIGENVKIKGESVDEHVTSFIEKRLDSQTKAKERRGRKHLSPKMQKIRELTAEGVSPEDAINQVQEEFGLPTLDERLEQEEKLSVSEPLLEKEFKQTEINNAETNRIIENNRNKEGVPLKSDASSLGTEDIFKLNSTLDKLNNKLDTRSNPQVNNVSGNFEATNIGDPLIESLAIGLLELE